VSAVTAADELRWRLPSFRRKVDRARARVTAMLETCPNPYVALSGGKDSLVTLALVCEQRPGVDIGRCYSMAPIDWIVPWTSEPFFRPPEPDMEDFGASIKTAAGSVGYGGSFVGLRAEEAMIRELNLRRRGMLYQTVNGQWHCQPIARWLVDEVWAVIAGMGLPYNPAYDEMAAVGIRRDEQRIGALPLAPGWVLERVWPGMFRELVGRYGARW